MKPAAQPISNRRLDRALLWSRLWLLRIASFILQSTALFAPLERAAETALKPILEKFAKIILTLIALKARQILPKPKPKSLKRYAPHKTASALMRRIYGARLRRLIKARTCGAKIAALLALLDSAETEIARLAKRLRAGLTRRRGGVKPEVRAENLGLYWAAQLNCADTS